MSYKTKLFSVLIFGLLLLPIFINPDRTGQVLGISESSQSDSASPTPSIFGTLQSNSQSQQTEITKDIQIGEIGSGVHSVRAQEENPQPIAEFVGVALMNSNTAIPVSSDKFPLGSSIVVVVNGKSYNLVVQSRSVLSTDTILVLDRKTFESIGGDPEVGSINVVANLAS